MLYLLPINTSIHKFIEKTLKSFTTHFYISFNSYIQKAADIRIRYNRININIVLQKVTNLMFH